MKNKTKKKPFGFHIFISLMFLLLSAGILILSLSPGEETLSQTENRMLAARPEFTFEGFFSGEFSEALEDYLSDRFPLRDSLVTFVESALDRLSLLNSDQTIHLKNITADALDAGDETADGEDGETQDEACVDEARPEEDWPEESGDLSTETCEEDAADFSVEKLPTDGTVNPDTEDTAEDEPETDAGSVEAAGDSEDVPAEKLTETDATEESSADTALTLKQQYSREKYRLKNDTSTTSIELITNEGEKIEIYTYLNSRIYLTALLLNRLTELLPEDGHVYFTFVPRGEFVKQYSLGLDKYRELRSNVEDYITPLVNDRVSVYSTTKILDSHIRAGEYVYYNTDLHWTLLGAWYVHKEMVESQGIKAVPYEDNGWETSEETFRGTLAKKHSPLVTKTEYDTVDVITPAIPYDYYTVRHLNQYYPRGLYENSSGQYEGYPGSNSGPWRLITTYENTGRKMLLISDSMGNGFATMMLSYYDEVHHICPKGGSSFNFKEAGGTIKDFIDYYGIDDIYVISTAILGTESYRDYIDKYMGD